MARKLNINLDGYRKDSPNQSNSYNIIPDNRISMEGVNKKLILVPFAQDGGQGNPILAHPGEEHFFPDYTHVLEIPYQETSQSRNLPNIKSEQKRFIKGSPEPKDAGKVPAKSLRSQANQGVYETGGPTKNKAAEMLNDGTANGYPLSQKQINYFHSIVNKMTGGMANPNKNINKGVKKKLYYGIIEGKFGGNTEAKIDNNYITNPKMLQVIREYGGPAGEHLASLPSFMQIGGPAINQNLVDSYTKGRTRYVKDLTDKGWYTNQGDTVHPRTPIPTQMIPQGQRPTGYTTRAGDTTNYFIPHGNTWVPSTDAEFTKLGYNPTNTNAYAQTINNTGINQQQTQQLSGQPIKQQKEGGQHQFEDTSFVDDKKNNFLNWLKNTSMNVIHNDIQNEHNQFVNQFQTGGGLGSGDPSQGTRSQSIQRSFQKDGGCHECDMMNFGGGIPYQNSAFGGDISIPNLHPANQMRRGGSRKSHGTDLRSYCQGPLTKECITSALNSPNPKIRSAAAFHQSNMVRSTMQYGGEGSPENDAFWAGRPATDRTMVNPNPNYNINPGYSATPGMNWVNPIQATPQQGSNLLQPNMQSFPMITNQQLASNSTQQFQGNQEQQMNKQFTKNTQGKFNWQGLMNNIPDGETKALKTLAGIDTVTGLLNAKEAKKREKELRSKTHADNVFTPVNGNMVSRGDYSVNEGYFRPNSDVPTQFQGQAGQYRKQGGSYKKNQELYLSDKEIQDLRSQGYQIEEY